MNALVYTAVLLLVDTPSTASVIGPSYAIVPDQPGVDPSEASYAVYFEATMAAGGTQPTLNARVEQQAPGMTGWLTATAMVERTTQGTTTERDDLSAAIGPVVRGVIAAGGTAPAPVSGRVILASSEPFRLIRT